MSLPPNDLEHSHPEAAPDPDPLLGRGTGLDIRNNSLWNARKLFGAERWSINLERPAPPWLVPDLLQAQSIHVLSAAKGCYKTWLGLSLFLAGIYDGIPVLGQLPARRYRSIYLGADSPKWDIRGQLRSLLRGHGKKAVFPTDADSFLLPYGFKFTNSDHIKALQDMVEAFSIDVLFIDVLLYAHDGLNENDNSDMGRLFQLVKYCRDVLGLAVVLLHHHTKPSEINPAGGARGAGTIIQAAEHHYEFRRKKDKSVHLHRDKIRGRETWNDLDFRLIYPDATSARLEVVVPEPPAATPPPKAPEPELALRIREALKASPKSAAWLSTNLGCSPATIYRALSKMPGLTATSGVWSLKCPPPPTK